MGETIEREVRFAYVPSKGNKGTFQLDIQDKSPEEREDHGIPHSKQQKVHEPRRKDLGGLVVKICEAPKAGRPTFPDRRMTLLKET